MQNTPSEAKQSRFSLQGFWSGARRSLPLALSVLAYGAVFGELAKQTGIALMRTGLMSALVFAGAAQFEALELKTIYAASSEQAEQALLACSEKWDGTYPMISQSWWPWDSLTTFFDFPPEIRKVICTTNAIESLNSSFRTILKTKGSFPNDEAVFKLYLAFKNIAKKWTRPIANWSLALNSSLAEIQPTE